MDSCNGHLFERSQEQLRPLLKLIDDLRKILQRIDDVNVTTVIAVGDQSHGKTSVIEALSGVDLPRGEGIKTRLPLELRLRAVDDDSEEKATIQTEDHEEKEIGMDEISAEVERITEELAPGKKVVDKSIILTIHKRGHNDLTIVDLPGITRVAIDGQDKDIGKHIKKMYRRYMEKPETIILNVAMANVNYTTSESIELADKFDPDHKRSLICLTKVDKATNSEVKEEVTRAKASGYHVFAVRNRTQMENDMCMSLDQVRALERERLDELDIPDEVKGVALLSEKLVELQRDNIREILPSLGEELNRKYIEEERRLKGLPLNPENEGQALIILQKLTEAVRTTLQHHIKGSMMEEHYSAAGDVDRMLCAQYSELEEKFAEDIRKSRNRNQSQVYFSSKTCKQKARALLKSFAGGECLPDSTPDIVGIKLLIERQDLWTKAVDTFVTNAIRVVRETVNSIVEEKAVHLKAFKSRMVAKYSEVITEYGAKLKECTDQLLATEKRIGSRNPAYIKAVTEAQQEQERIKMQQVADTAYRQGTSSQQNRSASKPYEVPKQSVDPGQYEQQRLDKLLARCSSYWDLACERVIDNTTQHTFYILLDQCKDALSTASFELLAGADVVQMAKPPPSIIRQIVTSKERLESFEKATARLHEHGVDSC